MRKEGRGHLTDRHERNQSQIYERPEYMVSQFYVKPEPKQSQITENNSWIGATQKAFKSQFVDIEGRKPQHYTPFTFDNLPYQQS